LLLTPSLALATSSTARITADYGDRRITVLDFGVDFDFGISVTVH